VNPSFRKAALIAAALGLLISLYFALRPNGDEETTTTTTAAETTPGQQTTTEATTTEATTTTAPAEPQVVRVRITVPGDTVPKVKKFSVGRDKQLEIVVDSALADEVHLHGYDLSADVAPGKPATIRFKANAPGRFEIELESRRLPIAELEVRP
jgi:hypothetical protein